MVPFLDSKWAEDPHFTGSHGIGKVTERHQWQPGPGPGLRPMAVSMSQCLLVPCTPFHPDLPGDLLCRVVQGSDTDLGVGLCESLSVPHPLERPGYE